MTLSLQKQSYIAAALFIGLALIALFDPLPEPSQSIVQAAIFFPTAIWAFIITQRCHDEVMKHASRKAFSLGVPIGAGAVMTFVLAMRYWTPATDFVLELTNQSAGGLPPEAVGFGMGAMFALVVIGLTTTAIYAIWWQRTR